MSYYNDYERYWFRIEDCWDEELGFDQDAYDGAIMDGEYVPEDW